jgi:type IV secretory pathway TraG/TraD family ATPase VirD4
MKWNSNWVVLFAVLMLACLGASRRGRRPATETHKRGVRLIDVSRRSILSRCGIGARRGSGVRRKASPGQITMAGIAIPGLDETKHFKLIGTTGTGKSTAIREILNAAIARGDRAVVADPDGGYLASFHRRFRGDIVLNPFERDSVKWDLFGEIRDRYDVEQLASGLISTSQDPAAREWRGYARTFMTAVMRRCHEAAWCDTGNLWRLLMVASPEELRPLIADTPAQPFLEAENARMFGSIRSVTGSAIAALEYIQRQRSVPFSVREWVRNRSRSGLLFIPYKANQLAALRSMIAAWMRLAIFEALSQPEGLDQRLWFVVDELDALGQIDGLKDALARLRKFGGRCVLGFQSLAQVSDTYGPGEAHTIVENCGNTLILRCSGSENGGTSQFASKLIGEREILRRQVSRGTDREALLAARGARRSRSVTEQHITESAVMPSELEQLPDLCGYFKGASSACWLKVAYGNRS